MEELLGSPTGRLVLAVIGLAVIARLAMRLFAKSPEPPAYVRARCPECGWSGRVGKYNRRCSACGGTNVETG